MNSFRRMYIHNFLNKYIRIPILGETGTIKYLYKKRMGEKLNLDNPKKYNEKIQRRKLEKNNPLYIKCADKIAVREYVKEKIGEKYLIPLYLTTDKLSLKNIEELPNSFILKTNNASGTNIIVFDKEKENLKKIIKLMNRYIKIRYGYVGLELFYNRIKPKIIAEKLILNENDEIPEDFKFHCFKKNGEFKIIITHMYDRSTTPKKNGYDENWNFLPYEMGFPTGNKPLERPKEIGEMLDIVKKLAEDFEYIRVDLYLVKNKIYFGELTITPGSGYSKFRPPEYDEVWGSYWNQLN